MTNQADDRNIMVASELRHAGFGVELFSNATFAYLTNRNIGTQEIKTALGEIGELITVQVAISNGRRGVSA